MLYVEGGGTSLSSRTRLTWLSWGRSPVGPLSGCPHLSALSGTHPGGQRHVSAPGALWLPFRTATLGQGAAAGSGGGGQGTRLRPRCTPLTEPTMCDTPSSWVLGAVPSPSLSSGPCTVPCSPPPPLRDHVSFLFARAACFLSGPCRRAGRGGRCVTVVECARGVRRCLS